MKTETKEEIEAKDSYAIASILDYCKEYDAETNILAFLILLRRDEVRILNSRIRKFKDFANSQGSDAQILLEKYIHSSSLPEIKSKVIEDNIYRMFNMPKFEYEFTKLGNFANALGYVVGFMLVLSLLTITAGIAIIIGLIIYKIGFRFSKAGFLIYDHYKSFVRNETSLEQFKKAWNKSLVITILITIFFALLSVFLIGNLSYNDNSYLYSPLILAIFFLPLIPNYLLLSKLNTTYFKAIL